MRFYISFFSLYKMVTKYTFRFFALFFLFFITTFSLVCVDWSPPPMATKTIKLVPTPTTTAPCSPGMTFSGSPSVLLEHSVPESLALTALVKFDCRVLLSLVALFCRVRVCGSVCPPVVEIGLVAGCCADLTPSSPLPILVVEQETPPARLPPPTRLLAKKQKKMVVLNRATILRNAAIAEKYCFKK